jgi:hypothetical protein
MISGDGLAKRWEMMHAVGCFGIDSGLCRDGCVDSGWHRSMKTLALFLVSDLRCHKSKKNRTLSVPTSNHW